MLSTPSFFLQVQHFVSYTHKTIHYLCRHIQYTFFGNEIQLSLFSSVHKQIQFFSVNLKFQVHCVFFVQVYLFFVYLCLIKRDLFSHLFKSSQLKGWMRPRLSKWLLIQILSAQIRLNYQETDQYVRPFISKIGESFMPAELELEILRKHL